MNKNTTSAKNATQGTAFAILLTLSITHLLNDTLQSLIPASYPLLKKTFDLDFTQIGLITLVFQLSSSLFQPLVGWYTDKHPKPYLLPIGMTFTFLGILILSQAINFQFILLAVALTGIGSSIFHPEASKLAYMASGGKHGTAQSLFQVGGNLGGSLGPLLVALIIAHLGIKHLGWFSLLAIACIIIMLKVTKWHKANLYRLKTNDKANIQVAQPPFAKGKTLISLLILLILIFSKYIYMASFTSYYTFYLIDKFNISTADSLIYLFIFLFSVAAGTLLGGPIGDRFGRKYVIWTSILGTAPFALLMPHAGLTMTCILSVFIGLILSSAFSAILVYAQELLPNKIGMISGLFFGFAFGIAGIGSALLGKIADERSISFVYEICAYLPLIGLVTYFLPNLKKS